jgi:hypothetical protein
LIPSYQDNPHKSRPQLFPNPFSSAPCDIFNCNRRAKYFIGRPDGPLSIGFRICEDCARSVIDLLPDELKGLACAPQGLPIDALPVIDLLPDELKGLACAPQGLPTDALPAPPPVTPKLLTCPGCGKQFKNAGLLSSHQRFCSKKKPEEWGL